MFMKRRQVQCNGLRVGDVALFCFAHSDAENDVYRREENEYAAAETVEWHRKKFPNIPVLLLPYCKSWQDWMMYILKPICKHYGVSDDVVLKDWTQHYGYGMFLELKNSITVDCSHAFVQLSGESEIYCSKCGERRPARGSNVQWPGGL